MSTSMTYFTTNSGVLGRQYKVLTLALVFASENETTFHIAFRDISDIFWTSRCARADALLKPFSSDSCLMV